ncbi:MAG: hypothetical protein GY820_20565 [Gammaproteobacteria bacterium]|nr:hypothetical protein [Gammaproteobacteria bacterium]
MEKEKSAKNLQLRKHDSVKERGSERGGEVGGRRRATAKWEEMSENVTVYSKQSTDGMGVLHNTRERT